MVKIALRFINDQIIFNKELLANAIKREYPDKKVFTATVAPIRQPKTYSQLRYFHSDGLMGRMISAFREAGYDVPLGKSQAVEWVKFQIKTHPDIGFMVKRKNVLTGEEKVELRSFSDASKEEMSKIIEWCIRIFQEYFGVTLETVADYKKRMGFNKCTRATKEI